MPVKKKLKADAVGAKGELEVLDLTISLSQKDEASEIVVLSDDDSDLFEPFPDVPEEQWEGPKVEEIDCNSEEWTTPEPGNVSDTKDEAELPEKPVRNAFQALMESHAVAKKWKIADDAEQAVKTHKEIRKREREEGKVTASKPTPKRHVPFYKWIDGTSVTVDAFRYGGIQGCTSYFLSHAHSDHYQNLSKNWTYGPVYCSQVTANLVKLKLKVPDQYIRPLPLDTRLYIPESNIYVTLIDANHCPGSVLFLFETHSKRTYLHCGDFRASPMQVNHPAVKDKRIDIIYLDTTYLDPKYTFPAQDVVIETCCKVVRAHSRFLAIPTAAQMGLPHEERSTLSNMVSMMAKWVTNKPEEKVEEKPHHRLLVLVGTYSIGKERLAKGVAHMLDSKIYCTDYKKGILDAQEDSQLDDLLTDDPYEAQVHLVNLWDINRKYLVGYLDHYKYNSEKNTKGFTKLVGLRPTGWTFRKSEDEKPAPGPISLAGLLDKYSRNGSYVGIQPQKDSTPACLAYGVPYSEHSSFIELSCFALSLNYGRIIPTVNVGNANSRAKMNRWFDEWRKEKDRRRKAGLAMYIEPRAENYW